MKGYLERTGVLLYEFDRNWVTYQTVSDIGNELYNTLIKTGRFNPFND